MNVLNNIKESLVEKLNQIIGEEFIKKEDLSHPPQKQMGDLSLPCFNLAKNLKRDPRELAEELKEQVKVENIAKTEVIGPYLNFFFDQKKLAEQVISEILESKESYGQNTFGKGQKVMVEYFNVNTHKECHIGHLRNACFGEAVNRILKNNGYQSIPAFYINDFGIHVAKTLWNWDDHLKKNYPDQDVETFSDKQKGYILGKAYSEAAQKLKEDESKQEEVNKLMKKIEKRKGAEYELWQKTRQWNIDQFEQIQKELGIAFEGRFYESDYIEKGKEMVQKLLKQGVLKKSQGAVIADLEKYGLGVLIFLRSDGTATYPVADLPLAKDKIDKYELDKSIYVVDNRQTLYFKQLFKVLELMGYEQEMIHLSYEFVKLPGGMISSRSGNVITYEELREQVLSKSVEETQKKHPDWSKEKVEQIAEKIGMNAIKFEMLKVDSQNIITFDIDQALSFDGFTSAYIQYTAARIQSILKKASETSFDSSGTEFLTEDKEHDLILKLAKYPELMFQAGKNFDPSEIAKYLFELSQLFNDYYHQVPILQSDKEIRKARLVLLKTVEQTIENGLKTLVLTPVSEM